MSIRLSVAPYCEDCPGFEAKVDRDEVEYIAMDQAVSYRTETTVSCKYAGRCASIYRFIKKNVDGGKKND